jgi:uncharacterized protein (TIGR00251 family)
VVKVTSNATSDEIVGWHDNALKVRVKAKPIKGQANAAVCKLLARTLGVAVSQVSIKTGTTSSRKTLWINGLSSEAIATALAELDAGEHL